MTKLFALILAAALMLVFVSCGNMGNEQTTGGPAKTEGTESTTAPEATSEEAESTGETTAPEQTTGPADTEEEPDELFGLIEDIYEIQPTGFMVITEELSLDDPEMLKMQTGISDGSKVDKIYMSEGMRATAYSLILVRVKDEADAEDIANEMLDGVDPNKWICVGADDIRVGVSGDIVMLVMAKSSYDVTADDILDAFRTVCGGKLDLELEN